MKKTWRDDLKLQNVDNVFLDIDGTLLTSKHTLPRRVLLAIRAILKYVNVTLVSGRPYTGVIDFYHLFNLHGYLICLNGGVVLNGDLKVIYKATLNKEDLYKIFEVAKQVGLSMNVFAPTIWYTDDITNEYVQLEANIIHHQPIQIDDIKTVFAKDIVKVILFGSKEKLDKLPAILAPLFPHLERVRTYENYFELFTKEAKKGYGTNEVIKALNTTPEHCLAIGDSFNDLAMFESVTYSVAVSNSKKEIQQAATYVIDSNDHGGVGKFLKDLLKIKSKC
jgi:Cof subfamily protein (haloacid dehalogenase superfamily)